MYCKNCGNEVKTNAKFCNNCGKKIQMEEDGAVMEEFTPELGMKSPSKKDGKKTGIIIGAVVLVLALVVGIGFKLMMSTPEEKVKAAFVKTGTTIVNELKEIGGALPLVALFEDFATEQYAMEFEFESYDTDFSVDIAFDNATSQMKMTPNIMGFGGDILVSEDYITIETDLLDDVYGVDVESLEDDLRDEGYMQEYPQEGIFNISKDDFLAEQEVAIEGMAEIVGSGMVELVAALSVEELGEKTIEIDRDDIDTDAYRILMDWDVVETVMETTFDGILENEAIVKYLNRQIINYAIVERMPMEYLEMDDLEDTRTLEKVFDIILDEYEDMYDDLEDAEFVVYINDDKVVCVSVETNYGILELQLGTEEKILDRMAVVNTYFSGSTKTYELFVEMNGSELEVEVDEDGGTIFCLEYDISESKDNVEIEVYGDSLIMTINSTKEDTVIFSIEEGSEGASLSIEKADLDKNWFVQDADFIDIMELSESDLEEIAMKVMFSMM